MRLAVKKSGVDQKKVMENTRRRQDKQRPREKR
jgi:hypothetical protein